MQTPCIKKPEKVKIKQEHFEIKYQLYIVIGGKKQCSPGHSDVASKIDQY